MLSFADFQIQNTVLILFTFDAQDAKHVCYIDLKVMIIQQRLQNIILREQKFCKILQILNSRIVFHKTTILMNQKQ